LVGDLGVIHASLGVLGGDEGATRVFVGVMKHMLGVVLARVGLGTRVRREEGGRRRERVRQ